MCWRARYTMTTPDKSYNWEVECESRECPRSAITEASLHTIKRFMDSKRAAKSGGVLYGPDSSRWPARWYDTVVLLESEIEREDAAAKTAIHATP